MILLLFCRDWSTHGTSISALGGTADHHSAIHIVDRDFRSARDGALPNTHPQAQAKIRRNVAEGFACSCPQAGNGTTRWQWPWLCVSITLDLSTQRGAAQTKAGFVVMNGAVQFQESPFEVLSAHGIEPR